MERKNRTIIFFLLLIFLGTSCKTADDASIKPSDNNDNPSEMGVKVTKATTSGTTTNYSFSVTLESPDTGCDQYADWWEVVSMETGELLYRRILAHSHVDEQPFTRSGGPANATPSDQLMIRGHMNNLGYGKVVLVGSVSDGFVSDTIGRNFAISLETAAPLPNDCAF